MKKGNILKINIDELGSIPVSEAKNIEYLTIVFNKIVSLPPIQIDMSLDNEVMMEEIDILNKLRAIENFKNLKQLYFSNIFLSRVPNEIISLKKLEIVQFNYYRFFDPIAEYKKLVMLKKLKKLNINQFYLPDDKVSKLKKLLIKVNVEDFYKS